jgi:CubicO group peptidase (beta-lactamase class C family)
MRALALLCLLATAARAETLTVAGATLARPAEFAVTTLPSGAILTPPETDTHIAIIAVPAAATPTEAAAKAWQIYHPGFKRPLKVITPRPAKDGWDASWHVDYETSPNERADVEAFASRQGAVWTVLLIEGTEPTLEKRLAPVSLIIGSLRPQGYQPETFAGRTAHPLNAARIEAIKDFVKTSMQELGVPGVGLALIDHDKVVYEGGLGVRKLGDPTPVDEHTKFIIASNTKGMTTLLLATLVDEGKLRWDEKVTDAYPSFKLGNADTTGKVLIRHLICACTGLPRQDLEWLLNAGTATQAKRTFTTLAAMQPTSKFGETFQYSNLMASAAGYIAAHILHPDEEFGAAYDQSMQERIFAPLGMTETTFSFDDALDSNYATPHGDDINGHPKVARMDLNFTITSARPAGGAWSTAHDMIKYVRNELDEGKLPNGKQLVSPANLLIRRAHGVPIGENQYYGMGLETDDRWGVTAVHHGGSLAGYKSDIIAIPSAGVGAVILANADDGGFMLSPFRRRLLEILYDGKPEAALQVTAAAADNQVQIAAERKRLQFPADPKLFADLAPHYENKALGHIEVLTGRGGVLFNFGTWRSQAASRRNDDGTISFITVEPTVSGFEFVVAEKDHKHVLITRDGQHEYAYTEAPPE